MPLRATTGSSGEDVRFLTGTDENSLKNVQAAEARGHPDAELVDRNAATVSRRCASR